MISAGQVPAASGSAPAPQPPAPQPPQPPAQGPVLPAISGKPDDNGCMYNRGTDKIGEGDSAVLMSSFSVAGLNTYAMRTAAFLDPSVDRTYLDYMYALYEPDQFLRIDRDSHTAIMRSDAAPRVDFKRVCQLDDGWTAADGQMQYTWGSLSRRGVMEFDDAASNWFWDFLGDMEAEPEQQALLKSMKSLGMQNWNNRLVHYLGAFGDGVYGTYMAQAFRGEGMEDTDKATVTAYVAKVRDRLKAANQADDGIMVLLGAFAPVGMDEAAIQAAVKTFDAEKKVDPFAADRASVTSALNLIGKKTRQEEFAKVVGAGYDFNVARNLYDKVMAFRNAHQEEMKKANQDRLNGKPPKYPNTPDNQKNAQVALFEIMLMVNSLGAVKEDELTHDQREFKYMMMSWADVAIKELSLFIGPVPRQPGPVKPKQPGPGPKTDDGWGKDPNPSKR